MADQSKPRVVTRSMLASDEESNLKITSENVVNHSMSHDTINLFALRGGERTDKKA